MRHPRRKHKGYKGRGATPWKYRLDNGSLVRCGERYLVRITTKDGVVLWEGVVVG